MVPARPRAAPPRPGQGPLARQLSRPALRRGDRRQEEGLRGPASTAGWPRTGSRSCATCSPFPTPASTPTSTPRPSNSWSTTPAGPRRTPPTWSTHCWSWSCGCGGRAGERSPLGRVHLRSRRPEHPRARLRVARPPRPGRPPPRVRRPERALARDRRPEPARDRGGRASRTVPEPYAPDGHRAALPRGESVGHRSRRVAPAGLGRARCLRPGRRPLRGPRRVATRPRQAPEGRAGRRSRRRRRRRQRRAGRLGIEAQPRRPADPHRRRPVPLPPRGVVRPAGRAGPRLAGVTLHRGIPRRHRARAARGPPPHRGPGAGDQRCLRRRHPRPGGHHGAGRLDADGVRRPARDRRRGSGTVARRRVRPGQVRLQAAAVRRDRPADGRLTGRCQPAGPGALLGLGGDVARRLGGRADGGARQLRRRRARSAALGPSRPCRTHYSFDAWSDEWTRGGADRDAPKCGAPLVRSSPRRSRSRPRSSTGRSSRSCATRGYEVHVVTSPGPQVALLAELSHTVHELPMHRGVSPLKDLVGLVRWIVLLTAAAPRRRPRRHSQGRPAEHAGRSDHRGAATHLLPPGPAPGGFQRSRSAGSWP